MSEDRLRKFCQKNLTLEQTEKLLTILGVRATEPSLEFIGKYSKQDEEIFNSKEARYVHEIFESGRKFKLVIWYLD